MLKFPEKIKSFSFWASLLFWVFIFFLFLQHSFSYLDPDLGWHLESGQKTFLSGQATRTNDHNFSLPTNVWLDHEWLANLWLYQAYQAGYYPEINVFFSLLVLLGLLIIFPRQAKWPAYFLLIISAIAIAPHCGVRMQEFTFVFTALLFLLIKQYEKKKDWRWLLAWPPLLAFWANVHAGFLIGLFSIGLFFLVKVVKNGLKTKEIWLLALFSFLSLLFTLINPYGLELYKFLFAYRDTFYLSHIMEWLPQWDYPYQYWQLLYLSLITLSLVAVYKNKKIRPDIFSLILMLVMILLAFKSRRNIPLLVAVSFPFLVTSANYFLLKESVKKKKLLVLKFFTIFALLFSISSQVLAVKIIHEPFEELACQKNICFPLKAISWLETKPELADLRIFNEFGWGGYLLWRYPQGQLFIDGRQPQAKMTDVSALEEYYRFFRDQQASEKLKEHKIEMVWLRKPRPEEKEKRTWWKKLLILEYEKIITAEEKNELLEYLDNSSDWNLIYQDEASLIYLPK